MEEYELQALPARLRTVLLYGVLASTERVHFCMCNPPFFDLGETPQPNLSTHKQTRCTATEGEQFVSGGEVGFVLRLVADSLILGEQVRWYSSLIACTFGKLWSAGAWPCRLSLCVRLCELSHTGTVTDMASQHTK